jgi:ribose/xylose/arabinose/galactoside ABC-type transport system permease subunit
MKTRGSKIDVQKLVIVGVLIIIMSVLSILTPKFLTYINFNNVIMQVALIMLTGSALSLLMISGNIDLSIGSVLAFTGVMHAYMSKYWFPTGLSITFAIILGGIYGLVNGLVVSKLKITSVIATLGTMYIARGLAFIIARADGGANITSGLPSNFEVLGRATVGVVPLHVLIVIAIIIVFVFIQIKTNLGRYAFVIGGNRTAALLSGVKVDTVIITLFVLVGALTGFCGTILVSRIGSGIPRIGAGFEFDVIVAVVLGGTSIYGGEGSVFGMVIGALIVGFIANGLNLLDVQAFYQVVFKGLILVAAILLDRWVKERL